MAANFDDAKLLLKTIFKIKKNAHATNVNVIIDINPASSIPL